MTARRTEPLTNLHVELPARLVRAVEDYQHRKRLPSRTAALERLIEAGIEAERKERKRGK